MSYDLHGQNYGVHIQYIEMSGLSHPLLQRVASNPSFKIAALNDTSHYYRIRENVLILIKAVSVMCAFVLCLGGLITLSRGYSTSAVCDSINFSYFLLMAGRLPVLISMLTLRNAYQSCSRSQYFISMALSGTSSAIHIVGMVKLLIF